jgi:hypothetical protein
VTSSATCAPTVRGSCAKGGNRSFWGFDAERSTPVPRHREVAFRLVRKICADLGIPPPSGQR